MKAASDFSLLCDSRSLGGALAKVRRHDGASLPLLTAETCKALLRACETLSYRPARPIVGTAERQVRQDFEVCMEIPQSSPLRTLATRLQGLLMEASARLDTPPLEPGFRFNDFIVQRYQPGSHGITPHVDHIRYRGLVAIIVLSGTGAFALCDDRAGQGARPIPAHPGDLLLMRAPGFDGDGRRPFHRLSDVLGERVILGLRWDNRNDAPW